MLSVGVDALLQAGLTDITIVAGAHPESVWRASQPITSPIHIVEHKAWEEGQLSSLLAGLETIWTPDLEAVVVMLVDVPLVRPETIRAVVDAWRVSRALIVRPVDGDRHGHPVVFDAAVFDDLRRADPSIGAKAVFAAYRDRVLNVPVDDRWAFEDLDTPEDYERIMKALE